MRWRNRCGRVKLGEAPLFCDVCVGRVGGGSMAVFAPTLTPTMEEFLWERHAYGVSRVGGMVPFGGLGG